MILALFKWKSCVVYIDNGIVFVQVTSNRPPTLLVLHLELVAFLLLLQPAKVAVLRPRKVRRCLDAPMKGIAVLMQASMEDPAAPLYTPPPGRAKDIAGTHRSESQRMQSSFMKRGAEAVSQVSNEFAEGCTLAQSTLLVALRSAYQRPQQMRDLLMSTLGQIARITARRSSENHHSRA